MAENPLFWSRAPPSPPPSEDGCCPSGGRTVELHLKPANVNNSTITTHSPPPTPPQNPRRVRDRLSVQKEREINRSKQFTNRLQRSASSTSPEDTVRRDSNIRRRTVQRYSAPVQDAGKNNEKANEQVLTKMAFAEQQRWITVQQKTFTKWYSLHD
jgi:type IV secretory pathway VirB10-like protein